jgi:Ca2+-binding RTX toxin-like protein
VFSGAFGRDVVTDFDRNGDVIQLDHSQFADFASVLAHAQQVGDNVVISLDADDTVTLLAYRLSNLNSGDFAFV